MEMQATAVIPDHQVADMAVIVVARMNIVRVGVVDHRARAIVDHKVDMVVPRERKDMADHKADHKDMVIPAATRVAMAGQEEDGILDITRAGIVAHRDMVIHEATRVVMVVHKVMVDHREQEADLENLSKVDGVHNKVAMVIQEETRVDSEVHSREVMANLKDGIMVVPRVDMVVHKAHRGMVVHRAGTVAARRIGTAVHKVDHSNMVADPI